MYLLFLIDRHRAGPHPWLHQHSFPRFPVTFWPLPAKGTTPGSVRPCWFGSRPPALCLMRLCSDRVPRGAGGPRVRSPGGVCVRRWVVGVVHPRRARARHIRWQRETFVITGRTWDRWFYAGSLVLLLLLKFGHLGFV